MEAKSPRKRRKLMPKNSRRDAVDKHCQQRTKLDLMMIIEDNKCQFIASMIDEKPNSSQSGS